MTSRHSSAHIALVSWLVLGFADPASATPGALREQLDQPYVSRAAMTRLSLPPRLERARFVYLRAQESAATIALELSAARRDGSHRRMRCLDEELSRANAGVSAVLHRYEQLEQATAARTPDVARLAHSLELLHRQMRDIRLAAFRCPGGAVVREGQTSVEVWVRGERIERDDDAPSR
jgi:hypothetical protein